MKKINFVFMIAFLSIILLFNQACEKDVSGCTDPDSKNYNSEANVSDNSCEYEGRISFWYKSECADFFASQDVDVTSLKFYVDDELIGSKSASTYFVSAPDCDNSEAVPVTKSLGSEKEKEITVKAVDEDGDEAWVGTTKLKANTCIQMELTLDAIYPNLKCSKTKN